VVKTIRQNQVTVIAGATGCGKVRNMRMTVSKYDVRFLNVNETYPIIDDASPSTGSRRSNPEQ
jgi:hypothetical protein